MKRLRLEFLTFILMMIGFASKPALAAVRNETLTTLRGAKIEVTIHEAGPKSPTIVIAPGQSCNSKGPLFEETGKQGLAAGFTVVRFEWAYCLIDPSKPAPSDDLKNEVEDFATALTFAQTLPSVDASKIFIAGKSLGSIVANMIFQNTPLAVGMVLLTPICENGEADATYPGLKKDPRPVLMSMGDKDLACPLPSLFDYLKDSKGNIQVITGGGDHGFRLTDSSGAVDDARTLKNITAVIGGVVNWAAISL